MKLKTIDNVCSRSVQAIHWRNVGTESAIALGERVLFAPAWGEGHRPWTSRLGCTHRHGNARAVEQECQRLKSSVADEQLGRQW